MISVLCCMPVLINAFYTDFDPSGLFTSMFGHGGGGHGTHYFSSGGPQFQFFGSAF